MPNKWESNAVGRDSPPDDAKDITPADSDLVGGVARGIYIDVAGTVKVTTAAGTVTTYSNLIVGAWHGMMISRVWATGTTASGIKVAY